jgi:methionine synthase II (cobalamin-independent)
VLGQPRRTIVGADRQEVPGASGTDDLRLWKEFPTDKELGAGVIDVKAFRAETPTEVAERAEGARIVRKEIGE